MKRHPTRPARLVAAVVVGIVAIACDDGPPGGPSKPQPTRLEIQGPSSITPGQTASFTVTERWSDGTTRTPATVNWTTTDPGLAQVTPTGAVTTQPRTGEFVLTVRSGRLAASREVMVLPDGTYRLTGRIMDTNTPSQPVPDVRLEVTGGTATATSGLDGTYRLYGAPGDGEIRLTRDGYRTHVQRLQLAANGSLNFVLEYDGSLHDYSGPYTLTIDAAPNCATTSRPLPEELRRRSYGATIRQDGLQLTVELTDARFLRRGSKPGNIFGGTVIPGGARFDLLTEYYYYFADVLEQLDDGSLLSPSGRAMTAGSPTGLSGQLSGWISHYTAGFSYVDGCSAGAFTLAPR